ncbi:MAG: cytidine deaminase [Acidimicrobiales bacterium]
MGAPGPVPDGPVPDWAVLREAAGAVAARAYAPYSGLRVGAAGLCDDSHVVTGCNVENASFGLTLCAECGLVSALVAHGRSRLVAVSVMAADGRPLAPCGRCRQVLMEHGGPELLVDGGPQAAAQRLGDLLPGAFDRSELEARPGPGARRGPGGDEPARRSRTAPAAR